MDKKLYFNPILRSLSSQNKNLSKIKKLPYTGTLYLTGHSFLLELQVKDDIFQNLF